jgi:hypothetical protein
MTTVAAAMTAVTVSEGSGRKDRQQHQNCQHGAKHSFHFCFPPVFWVFTDNTIRQRKSIHLF